MQGRQYSSCYFCLKYKTDQNSACLRYNVKALNYSLFLFYMKSLQIL